MNIQEKAIAFKALHEKEQAFIIPNPYDVGTTMLLEKAGFKALATSSAGYAFTCGRCDNDISRMQMIEHVRSVAAATHLPVSADLENGFCDDPAEVARTIVLAGEAGAVGGSIEDSVNGGCDVPQYDIGLAKERIAAAVEAKNELPFEFTLTARAENFLVGKPDIADVITRLQAYQDAGADVLFAPGLSSKADIEAVVNNVDKPVNVVMGLSGVQLGLAELSDMGVKRVSVGSSLSRAALGAFIRAIEEMIEKGTFSYADEAIQFAAIDAMFKE